MKTNITKLMAALMLATGLSHRTFASSHMDAPLITRDPAANTTDVYAFVSVENGQKYLVVALGVYPHEEPGIGPNAYNFDDNVLYQIHVATGRDRAAGRPSISYQFRFDTTYKNKKTILVSYLGVTGGDIPIKDPAQNLVQRYTVTKVDWHSRTVLGSGFVPPNNQGNATPQYNQGNNGENPAKDGVSNPADLDFHTQQANTPLKGGYLAFAGQRDDGFFADVQAVFDLLTLRSPGKDSQGGFNLHMIALRIPIAELGGDQQIAGVYATTSRPKVSVLRDDDRDRRGSDDRSSDSWVQVGRQGNPLFNEALVAVVDKDLYSRTSPSDDAKLFSEYALKPELARLLNLLVFEPDIPGIETDRTDIAAIYIPDMIKVDLSTDAARLAGSGFPHPTNQDDDGFSRLSIFDGDVLQSSISGHPFNIGGVVPGGWPNGRRFGDDVLDIAVTALISDLRVSPPVIRGPAGDNLDKNDIGYNKTFPYEGTPQNGRNHTHP
jgi:Domain of unknown function (DUF4331)